MQGAGCRVQGGGFEREKSHATRLRIPVALDLVWGVRCRA